MNTQDVFLILFPLAIIVPYLAVMIPQAIKDKKEYNELKDFPTWDDNKICPSCKHPIFPPPRMTGSGCNPFSGPRLHPWTLKCSKCDCKIPIKIRVEYDI